MRKAIKSALGKKVRPAASPRANAIRAAAARDTESRASLAEELLAEEPMETKRAAFIKAAIESVAVYHSLNDYADSQGAFFSVMKREGFDVLAWLGESQP